MDPNAQALICKCIEFASNTINLHPTAPFFVALFGLVKKVPCGTDVTNIFVVTTGELARQTLLVNEPR